MKKEHLTIPIDIIRDVVKKREERYFSLFLYLKFCAEGIINEKSFPFTDISADLGIKDIRTIKKYVKELLHRNWLGYDPKRQTYFIRSFNQLRGYLDDNTRIGAICNIESLKHIEAYLAACLIGFEVKRQRYIQNVLIRKFGGAAALKKQGALQLPSPYFLRPYFGLSNEGIGKVLGCSKSEANRLKMAAGRQGFLKLKNRFKFLAKLEKPDFNLRANMEERKKIRFTKTKTGEIKVFSQEMDEISSLVKYKIIKQVPCKIREHIKSR